MTDTDWLDQTLVKLIRFVEVYTDDEDISEADRKGINEAKAAITQRFQEEIRADRQAQRLITDEDIAKLEEGANDDKRGELKMYVWRDVLIDYASGLVCILAHDFEEAIEIAKTEFEDYIVREFAGAVYQVYDKPHGEYVYGGS